jgi:hypothetical protein
MKQIFLILIIIIIAIGGVFFVFRKSATKNNSTPTSLVGSSETMLPAQNAQDNQTINNNFRPPLDRAGERVVKKHFGIYITPQTSSVQPERFQGYHTGTDFEIFPEETNADVLVHAVCNGKLLLKEYASGYGGVAVQSCEFDNNPITVVYGHLNLASINAKIGDGLNAGGAIGNLGKAHSPETDGERKHLHLGFHKGSAINILGYVSSRSQLKDWLDPCIYLCK